MFAKLMPNTLVIYSFTSSCEIKIYNFLDCYYFTIKLYFESIDYSASFVLKYIGALVIVNNQS